MFSKYCVSNICICLSFLYSLNAQVEVSGMIEDEKGNSIVYANIVCLNKVDSTFVAGAISNDSGKFDILLPNLNNKQLRISSIGYTTQLIDVVSGKHQYNIVLPEEAGLLDEVLIVGKKKIYEQKIDRLVINVGEIPSMAGNSALQILAQSPGIIVEEGQSTISLNAKGEVLVMINDRVSRMPMTVLINQLRSMPAENIEQIEIIHQPPAKYESNFSGGIINIVLKKNTLQGFNGNVSISAGYGENIKSNSSISLNYRKNKVNLYGNIMYTHLKTPLLKLNMSREYTYNTNFYYGNNLKKNKDRDFLSGNFNVGLDYEVNKNTTIGVLFEYWKSKQEELASSQSVSSVDYLDLESFEYLVRGINTNPHNLINLNLNHKFNQNSTLNFDLDRIHNLYTNTSNLQDLNESTDLQEVNAGIDTDSELYSVKADYEYNKQDKFKFQTGAKLVTNTLGIESNYIEKENDVWTDGQLRSDFNGTAKENLYAAYSSIYKNFKHVEMEVGLRFEHYDFQYDSEVNPLKVEYNNLFPSVHSKIRLDSIRSLNITINRRTDRAQYKYAYGFLSISDPNLQISSNPTIRPSFTNTVRVAYQKNNVIFSIEAFKTKDLIGFHNRIDKPNDLYYINQVNFDERKGVILALNFPIKFTGFWKSNWSLNASNNQVKDASPNTELPIKVEKTAYFLQTNHSFQISKFWSANFNGYYRSPYLNALSINTRGVSLNAGVQKLFKNNSTLTFSINNITKKASTVKWEYSHPELEVRNYGENDFSDRVFSITYSFRFGDNTLKKKRNRETAAEEENSRM